MKDGEWRGNYVGEEGNRKEDTQQEITRETLCSLEAH